MCQLILPSLFCSNCHHLPPPSPYPPPKSTKKKPIYECPQNKPLFDSENRNNTTHRANNIGNHHLLFPSQPPPHPGVCPPSLACVAFDTASVCHLSICAVDRDGRRSRPPHRLHRARSPFNPLTPSFHLCTEALNHKIHLAKAHHQCQAFYVMPHPNTGILPFRR
jgi:hypothetical protein